jgi:probable rRNA maturation factor
MSLQVDIQTASAEPVPEEDDLRSWISAAMDKHAADTDAVISVRLVDRAEMAQLNHNYRGKAGPTNVLSFPAELPAEVELPLLGDIVICAPVVRAEAADQGKSERAHWAHMAVHGTLHLLGYDHQESAEAETMEAMESDILNDLDFDCPYGELPARETPA